MCNTIRTALLASLLSAFTTAASAACLDTLTVTTPSSEFVEITPSTVLHRPTSLEWQRCALGQQLSQDGMTCVGAPTLYSWDAALRAAAEFTAAQADGRPWYVPNIKELSSIVERQCSSPTINTAIFPTDVAYPFWSSTPNRTPSQQSITPLHFIDFDTGIDVETKNRPSQYAVRLVRPAF